MNRGGWIAARQPFTVLLLPHVDRSCTLNSVIAHPTTLVLGAGASAEYGYPFGSIFNNHILTDHIPEQDLLTADANPSLFQNFRDRFRGSEKSIDAFVANNPETDPFARIAIAKALLPYEENRDRLKGGWYGMLFNALPRPTDDIRYPLSVVSFNYDRSFEQFLRSAFASDYALSGDHLDREIARQMDIVHVYGDLGSLRPADATFRGYGMIGREAIKTASETITLIHRSTERKPHFDKAAEMISGAEYLVFLGFGFSF
jgi:hypothetical protein